MTLCAGEFRKCTFCAVKPVRSLSTVFIHPTIFFRPFGYGWDKPESSDLPMVGRSERMSKNEHITSRIIANEAASPTPSSGQLSTVSGQRWWTKVHAHQFLRGADKGRESLTF